MSDPLVPGSCLSCNTVDGYQLVVGEDELIVRHGIRFSVAGLKWYECKSCREVINTPTIVDANAALIDAAYVLRRKEFRSENNLLDPASIKTIRKALGETQESLSVLLGVGSNGLQKYETDKSCPSKPAELLLRVLAVQPSFLSTLKQIAAMPASVFAQPARVMANFSTLVPIDSSHAYGALGAFGGFMQLSSAGAVFGRLHRAILHAALGTVGSIIESADANDFLATQGFDTTQAALGVTCVDITAPKSSTLFDDQYFMPTTKSELRGFQYAS